MTYCRRSPLAVLLLALPFVLLAVPAQAQEVDTTAADTLAAEPAPQDTAAADTAAVDTLTTDTLTTDAADADTTTADTLAADTTMADTGQGAQPDTAAATELAPADTARGAATADTLTADTLAADTTALADTTTQKTLSPAERRARATDRARTVAASWLALTDAGKFGESWDAAAPTLQNGISRDQWIERGNRVRARLRARTNRELVRTQYRDSTRQIPGGRPVVSLQYETQYENQAVLEAVITTRHEDGWGVAGYRVVPNPEPDSTRAADTSRVADSTQAQPRPDSLRAPDSTQTRAAPDSAQALPADSTQGGSP